MVDLLSGMFCFVTTSASLIYGTRIAWVCGRKCDFNAVPENKIQAIYRCIPAAALVYLFGFIVLFSCLTDGVLTIIVLALTSSILLAVFIVSMAMPELKRNRHEK
jgi:hypothetical protein